MISKDKFIITILMSVFFLGGCINTTDTQFSRTVKKAKLNNTFVKEYKCNLIQDSSNIQVGQVWVEKVWYYEKFGSKSISNDKSLYVEFINNPYFDKIRYKNVILKEHTLSLSHFEGYSGYRIIGENIWYELTIKKEYPTIPDTLKFNVLYRGEKGTVEIGKFILFAR